MPGDRAGGPAHAHPAQSPGEPWRKALLRSLATWDSPLERNGIAADKSSATSNDYTWRRVHATIKNLRYAPPALPMLAGTTWQIRFLCLRLRPGVGHLSRICSESS